MADHSGGHICQCLSRLMTLRRNSTVTITGDNRMTGEQFVSGVFSLAHGLRRLGLRSGDVVAIAAFNSDLYLQWLLAVSFVGGIAAPLNYRWSFEEARSAMEIVEPVMLVTDESCSHWFALLQNNLILPIRWHVFMCSQSAVKGTENVLTTGTFMDNLALTSPSFSYSWAPELITLICFTSGTTGRPKGVKISHSALIVQSLAKIAIVGYSDDDVYLHTAPLCHIGGISSAMAMLMAGGCHVILPKFEAKLTFDAIEKHSVTSLITVPAMMTDLVSVIRTNQNWKGKQTVKKILNGGGSLSPQLISEAADFFPSAKMISAYGMTEACSSLTFMTLYDPSVVNSDQPSQMFGKIKFALSEQPEGNCVGKPAPHIEVRISVEDSSHVGKILTRGPHMMLGYWGQNLVRRSDPYEHGWFDTGDIGQIDDCGNVWLIGRANGCIKSGGESVFPEEIEAVLMQHPGIAAIAVVGVPDARLTEMVVACCHLKNNWYWINDGVVTTKEQCLSNETLRQYCKEKNLTGFKIPKVFVAWRKPFPFAASGKLRRDQVRKEAISQLSLLSSKL